MLKELQEILANSEHELTADNLRRLSTLAGEAKGELFSSFVKAFRKSVLPRTNAERLTGSAGVMAQTAILPLATEDRAALMVLKDADLSVIGKLAMIGGFAVVERGFRELAEAAETNYPQFDPTYKCDCDNCKNREALDEDE